MLHTGYDNRELIREDYEVLCEDRPCSLKYLAAKKIRDRLKELELARSKKCVLTKLNNVLLGIEQLFAAVTRKVSRLYLIQVTMKSKCQLSLVYVS